MLPVFVPISIYYFTILTGLIQLVIRKNSVKFPSSCNITIYYHFYQAIFVFKYYLIYNFIAEA